MTDLSYINAIKKVWESLDPRFKYEYMNPMNGNPYVADYMTFRRNPTVQENWYCEKDS